MVSKNLKILLNVNVSLFFTINLFSQVNVTITYPKDDKITPDLLWDFSVNNTSPFGYSIVFNYELKSIANKIYLHSNTTVFNIKPGNLKISPAMINSIVAYDYSNPSNKISLNPKKNLMPGEYQLCIKVIQVPEQIIIGENCIEFNIATADTHSTNLDNKGSNFRQKFDISGYSELYGYHANYLLDSNIVPTDILTWTFNPELEIFGLPVGMNMILTNDKNPFIKSANAFNFYFDADRYFENLKNRAINSVNQSRSQSLNENSLKDNNLNDYKEIEKILNSPQVKEDLLKIDRFNQLDSLLKDSSIIKNQVKYDSLKNEYDNSSDLIFKRNAYDRLKEKKSKLLNKYSDSCDKNLTILKKHKTEGITSDKISSQLTDSLFYTDPEKYDSLEKKIKKYEQSTYEIKEYADLLTDFKSYDIQSLQKQLSDSILLNDINKYDSINTKIKQYNNRCEKILKYEKIIEGCSTLKNLNNDTNIIKLTSSNLFYDNYKNIDISKFNDPQILTEYLTERDLIKKYQSLIIPIKKFSIGTNNPYFTELTLSNTQIKGSYIELGYKKVFASFSNGTLLNNYFGIQGSNYNRKHTALLLGYGDKKSSYLCLYYLTSHDNTSKDKIIDSSIISVTPKANEVIGVKVYTTTINKKLAFEGEISGSYLKSIYSIETNLYDTSPLISRSSSWLNSILSQKSYEFNAIVDYAFSTKIIADLFNKKSQISGGIKRIGPDYVSFGVPYLINDLISYELRYTQSLFKRKLIVSTYLTEKHDNLHNSKSLTTNALRLGLDASLNIPRYPYVKVNITPFALRNDSFNYYVNIYSFISGYSYNIKKLRSNTTISYITQQIVSESNAPNYTNCILYLTQNIIYKSKFINSICFGYVNSNYGDSITKNYTTDITSSLPLTKKSALTIGLNYFSGLTADKIGLIGEIRYSLSKYFIFNIRAESRSYDNYLLKEINKKSSDIMIRCSIITKW